MLLLSSLYPFQDSGQGRGLTSQWLQSRTSLQKCPEVGLLGNSKSCRVDMNLHMKDTSYAIIRVHREMWTQAHPPQHGETVGWHVKSRSDITTVKEAAEITTGNLMSKPVRGNYFICLPEPSKTDFQRDFLSFLKSFMDSLFSWAWNGRILFNL